MIRISMLALAALVALPACKKKVETEYEPVLLEPPPVEEQKPAPEPVQKMAANFSRVYFDYDSSTLNSESKSMLNANVTIMSDNPDIKIEIQGHADERGTTDYNLALGDRRANSVKNYMVSQGVAPSRLVSVSYGEERPLEGGQSERAWSKNRRAEFKITYGSANHLSGTVN